MDFYRHTPHRCRFMLYMAWLVFVASLVLNGYLFYRIGWYFSQDGFSFMGGLFIATALPFTVTLSIITLAMIRSMQKNRKKPAIFFLILSFPAMLTALIFSNATSLWIYILLFSFLLLPAAIICLKKEKDDNNASS